MNRIYFYLTATIVLTCLTTSASAQWFASQSFYSYDGPVKALKGSGGAKIAKYEIEYWVDGAPVRPFRIVGIMVDSRSDRWFSGSAVGSKAIAKKVKAAGGDAVIILDQAEKIASIVSSYSGSTFGSVGLFGNSASYSGLSFGTGSSEVISNVKTRLYVIAYLDAKGEESAVAATDVQPLDPAKAASFLPRAQQPSPEQVAQFVRGSSQPSPPPKRQAKTASGFCYEVDRSYVGAGTLSRPAITSYAPACWQIDPVS